MGKKVRYAVMAMLVAMFFVPKPACLLTCGEGAAWMHHFWHANIFHLLANLTAIWGVLGSRRWRAWELLCAYLFATMSYHSASMPVIGFSNAIFAMAGLAVPYHNAAAYFRNRNTIIFLAVMVLMLLVPQFSGITHIISFALGLICSFIVNGFKDINDEYKRARG